MKEIRGDLWEQKADALVLTTNGFVKKDGRAVMGAGCAKEARDRFPGLDRVLGDLISIGGNRVHYIGEYSGTMLFSMPVKHHWGDRADPKLIERSARELVKEADERGLRSVVVPRPGCGNGGLRWDDVRKLIDPILDDRFSVITFAVDE